jgi:hypothetical protein
MSSASPIPIEQFAKDLWEVLRDDMRVELDGVLDAEAFESRFPAWERLSNSVRQDKISIVRVDLLHQLDAAGYAVVRKS